MNEDKIREEFAAWAKDNITPEYWETAWDVWHAACASKQKELDDLIDANALAYKCSEQESLDRIIELEASLREQRQNQLDLMEKIDELKTQLRLAALEEYEKPPGSK